MPMASSGINTGVPPSLSIARSSPRFEGSEPASTPQMIFLLSGVQTRPHPGSYPRVPRPCQPSKCLCGSGGIIVLELEGFPVRKR